MMKPMTVLGKFWSSTSFSDHNIKHYAETQLLDETRIGVMTMCLVMFFVILTALPISMQLSLHNSYLYTYSLVAALSVHIFISAKKIDDLKTLHALGITLLTISATAFVSIAHETNSFSFLLFANVVVLFMAIPMVPWGLREASIIMVILYGLLTLSTGGMSERFGYDTLLILQFLMVTTAIISMLIVARSVSVRKDDLTTRYHLEEAKQHLFNLSNVDPLTNAYNRRFLQQAYVDLHKAHHQDYTNFHFIIFDIDDFKIHNDKHGHLVGDQILTIIGNKIIESLHNHGYLIRFGGDEFVILMVHQQPVEFMNSMRKNIQEECRSLINDQSLELDISFGLTTTELQQAMDLNELYQFADKILYDNKKMKKGMRNQVTVIEHEFTKAG